MSSVNHGSGFGSLLGTFIAGAAAGATIALLTTPRSGREMRARLKDATRELGERARQIPGAVQKAGAKAVKVGQAAFADAKNETTQAYNKVAEATREHKGYSLDQDLPRFAK
jgi:gas vesicle protein